jgi:SAM-dependent methyltransferase
MGTSTIEELTDDGARAFERLQQTVKDGSGQSSLPRLVHEVLPLEPGLTERLEQGIDVLNAGCGRGSALNLLARHFPASRFMGYELNETALASGRREAAARGHGNIRFVRKDPSWFLDTEAFDLILTFDTLDLADPEGAVANVHRALRPQGVYLMHANHRADFSGGAEENETGAGEAERLLTSPGFEKIEVHHLPSDGHNLYMISERKTVSIESSEDGETGGATDVSAMRSGLSFPNPFIASTGGVKV